MSRTYMAYLENIERDQMIFSKRFDIEAARIELMLEMCDRRMALQIEEAELKVLNESGTYEDLDYLYGAIMTEAEEAKKKLSIPERIKQLITLVLDGITALFTGERKLGSNAKIQIDKDLSEKLGLIGTIKKFVSLLRDALKSGIEKLVTFVSEHKVFTGAFISLSAIGAYKSSQKKTIRVMENPVMEKKLQKQMSIKR